MLIISRKYPKLFYGKSYYFLLRLSICLIYFQNYKRIKNTIYGIRNRFVTFEFKLSKSRTKLLFLLQTYLSHIFLAILFKTFFQNMSFFLRLQEPVWMNLKTRKKKRHFLRYISSSKKELVRINFEFSYVETWLYPMRGYESRDSDRSRSVKKCIAPLCIKHHKKDGKIIC